MNETGLNEESETENVEPTTSRLINQDIESDDVSLEPIRNQLISSNGSRRGCHKLCRGLAGEINRPQFLFYPLIDGEMNDTMILRPQLRYKTLGSSIRKVCSPQRPRTPRYRRPSVIAEVQVEPPADQS
jgi:hypothetical protein